MAPTEVSSMHKPLLQRFESTTHEPTTVTIECGCENTEKEKIGTEESDSESHEKTVHNPGKGTDPKTNAQGKENSILEDNTQIENTTCTCEGVFEEVTEESSSEEQEKTPHNPGLGSGPQTNAEGKENDTLEVNTQNENTTCTCEGVTEEVTEESGSEELEKTPHNPGLGSGPQTNAEGKENGTLEDNTQIENTPCTCEGGIEEVTKESDSEKQEKTTHNPGLGSGPQTNAKESRTPQENALTGNTSYSCENDIEEVTEKEKKKKEKNTKDESEKRKTNNP
ncbi:unnamed protein product [Sphenostylis stenocarpa]|uniref:Uncharacterized protein n=1 Tax=Sphenostylis stenocarpa TaxID=92480 RepID=A0AA86VEH8_9FABA|nr:unnamed protein product [Sphenostylis stenocarpa]